MVRNGLGIVLLEHGRPAEAEESVRPNRELLAGRTGWESYSLGLAECLTAEAREDQGDLEGAATLWQAGTDRMIAYDGITELVVGFVGNHGASLVRLGRLEEAKLRFQIVIDGDAVVRHASPFNKMVIRYWYGRCLNQLEGFREAETPLRAILNESPDTGAEESLVRSIVRVELGRALAGQDRPDEAEVLALRGVRGVLACAEASVDQRREAVQSMVLLYEQWERVDQADEWRSRLQGIDLSTPPEANVPGPTPS